jgi:hypothetical protein
MSDSYFTCMNGSLRVMPFGTVCKPKLPKRIGIWKRLRRLWNWRQFGFTAIYWFYIGWL